MGVRCGRVLELTLAIAFVDRFEYQTTHRRIAFHVYKGVSRVRKGTWREHPVTIMLARHSRAAISICW